MREKIIGVYMIKCLKNGMIYVGGSINAEVRWEYHKRSFKNKYFKNKYLNDDWIKYGEENFEFVTLEECLKENLLEREMHYTKLYKSNEREFGYNISCGNKLSAETKQKLSNINKGKIKSEETKQKLSNANKGRVVSKETKLKMSISHKLMSNETKQKMSIVKNGLTIEQSSEILKKLNNGFKIKQLYIEYNCCESSIKQIKYGKHWTSKLKEG